MTRATWSISLESLNLIMRFLSQHDKSTLAACTLVSSEFLQMAQPRLFGKISVDVAQNPDKGLSALLLFLCSTPHVAGHIRCLQIYDSSVDSNKEGDCHNASHSSTGAGTFEDTRISAGVIFPILHGLIGLQTLILDNVVIKTTPLALIPNCVSPISLSEVHISCAFMSNEECLFEFLRSFIRVDHLHIENLPHTNCDRIIQGVRHGVNTFRPLASQLSKATELDVPEGRSPEAVALNIGIAKLTIGSSPDTEPFSTLSFLQQIRQSSAAWTLTSISICINHYIVAAEFAKLLCRCGQSIVSLELDLKLPYYRKDLKGPLHAPAAWDNFCLSTCTSLTSLTVKSLVGWPGSSTVRSAPLRLFVDILSSATLPALTRLTCQLVYNKPRPLKGILHVLLMHQRYSMEWPKLRMFLEGCANLEILGFALQASFHAIAWQEIKEVLAREITQELGEWCGRGRAVTIEKLEA